jgi:HK97 family phage major capsid protein
VSAVFDRAIDSVALASAQRTVDALQMRARPDDRWNALCRQYDPQKLIAGLTRESISGAEKEASDELDRRRPRNDPNSAVIPWETLAYRSQRYAATRADYVGSVTAGGYLVETQNYPSAAGALLSMLILGRLGATPVNSTANLNLPKVLSSSTPYWLQTENTQITESDQTFGQVGFTPHMVGGYTEMSRLLLLQASPDAADTVASDLVRKIKRAIEAAAFSGSGTAGQPHGLIGLTGVNSVSGTTFALSTVATAVGDIGDALDPDTNPGWAAARSVAILLRQRQEFTNGTRTIWEGPATYGTLVDYNAAASSGVPAATAIFAAWKFLTLVDFAGGMEVSVNPFTPVSNFQAGIVGMRVFATLDVNAIWPAAFSIVSTIT